MLGGTAAALFATCVWTVAHPGWRPADRLAYCYLLGIYLGDGCITVASSRGVSLVVTLDAECPLIVNEVAAAMRGVVDEAWGDPAQPDGR